ncbi:hypothetical protein VN24_21325 [Paenibacillus beijingensis]|uniref:DUF3889 domain-containing protein n=1 Tax=Paenibacillus beijingensis TaxID=1126833 RepID=A0A0D5NRY1_9BACL|nr:hypothetical protein VN24_21325 [Paenibacillus beijingensis]
MLIWAVPALWAVPSISSAEPSYARFGRIAVKETIAKYGAEVVDYRYDGRFPLPDDMAEERFRLWLRKENREFGVTVHMTIVPSTNRLVSIRWESGTS